MRINVYSQELTKEACLVTKKLENGITYFGIRMFFDSSPRLHCTPSDDDRSAITFWVPYGDSFTACDLSMVFRNMADLAIDVYNDERYGR